MINYWHLTILARSWHCQVFPLRHRWCWFSGCYWSWKVHSICCRFWLAHHTSTCSHHHRDQVQSPFMICREDWTSRHGEHCRECRAKIRPFHPQKHSIPHSLWSHRQWVLWVVREGSIMVCNECNVLWCWVLTLLKCALSAVGRMSQ